MRIKSLDSFTLMLIIVFTVITGTAAAVPLNPSVVETGVSYPFYSLLYSHMGIMDTAYLAGNSDFGTPQESTMYLEQSGSRNTGNTVLETFLTGISPGIIRETSKKLITSNNPQLYSENYQSASIILSKIPSWLKIGCLIIDAVISGLLLYFAVTKKI